jgi:hypothetical protein
MPEWNKTQPPQNPIAVPPQGVIARLRSLFAPSLTQDTPNDFTERYTNAAYRFSFKHPPNLPIQVWQDGTTTVIRGRDPRKSVGFQICIRPLGGPDIPITAAHIARDLPHVAIKNPEPVHLHADSHTFRIIAPPPFPSRQPPLGRLWRPRPAQPAR